MHLYKTYRAEIKAVDSERGIVDAVVSNASRDRDNEVILPSSWGKRLASYKAHPVLLAGHNYTSLRANIGRATKIRATAEGLEARFQYFIGEDNPEADWAFKLAEKGLAAYSVGFIPHAFERGDGEKQPSYTYTDIELLEISQVTVPSNREALQSLSVKGFDALTRELAMEALEGWEDTDDIENRGAMPMHGGQTAPMDMTWDAAAEVRQAEGRAQLRRMHAWMDSDGDPEAKSSYKLPHHMHDGPVVWRGVAAAGAAVQGGRGGVNIPEADMAGVKRHLAAHYRQFDKAPPWEGARSMNDIDWTAVADSIVRGEAPLFVLARAAHALRKAAEDAAPQPEPTDGDETQQEETPPELTPELTLTAADILAPFEAALQEV